jgi:formamidopyrimidine-DNA glycosylase
MPELAEVEFYRRRWWETGKREIVHAAEAEPRSRDFRRLDAEFRGGAKALAEALAESRLQDSSTHGKQMWFVFAPARMPGVKMKKANATTMLWVGIHLGMSGELRIEPPDYRPARHDALILRLKKKALVFYDPRQFGRVRAWSGPRRETPPWLHKLPPEVTSAKFTVEIVQAALARHARAPLKAVLLQQEHFPGIGNWMADEILWRAALHPALPAGRAATPKTAAHLHAIVREVAKDALRVIAGVGKKLPPDLNAHIPKTWLFQHRWRDGGRCPKTGVPLLRAEIGGRSTCWSPKRQKAPKSGASSYN